MARKIWIDLWAERRTDKATIGKLSGDKAPAILCDDIVEQVALSKNADYRDLALKLGAALRRMEPLAGYIRLRFSGGHRCEKCRGEGETEATVKHSNTCIRAQVDEALATLEELTDV